LKERQSEIALRIEQAAAKKLDLFVRPVEMRSPRELTATFLQMRSEQIDGIVVTQDGLFYSARKEIADLALANRLPTIVYSRETVLAGALASYGPVSGGDGGILQDQGASWFSVGATTLFATAMLRSSRLPTD
jgi:ABC-type uncharacterized transport system substrate-binding protein